MHLHCIQFRQIHSYLLVRQVRAAASDFHLRHVLHSLYMIEWVVGYYHHIVTITCIVSIFQDIYTN